MATGNSTRRSLAKGLRSKGKSSPLEVLRQFRPYGEDTDDPADLYDLLVPINHLLSLMAVIIRSLELQQLAFDESNMLRPGEKLLIAMHEAINSIADNCGPEAG